MSVGAVSGFLAGLVNLIAIRAAESLHLKPGTGGLAALLFHHDLGAVGSASFHMALGTAMAVVYATIVQRVLHGPGWERGLLFAQAPGAVQLFAVLPLVGHGFGGAALSPFTPILAWSLNALYGALMGEGVSRLCRDLLCDANDRERPPVIEARTN
jgi:hypothetical protein